MIIALFANPKKPQSLEVLQGLTRLLSEKGVTVTSDSPYAEALGVQPLTSYQTNEIDFAVSLGGDGTILRLLQANPAMHAPIVGINMGSLGFLADTPLAEIKQSISMLLDGKYSIDKRFMIDITTERKEHFFAVNDLVVHRGQNPSLIDLAVVVDGSYLNTFSADGIIIATPSGSTAYSLSAGGPILSPDLRAVVITPINPHTISNRPIVLMPQREIIVAYLSHYGPIDVIVDGIPQAQMMADQKICITPSARHFCLVSFQHDYFATLRKKLGWQGTLRSESPSH